MLHPQPNTVTSTFWGLSQCPAGCPRNVGAQMKIHCNSGPIIPRGLLSDKITKECAEIRVGI